MVVSPFIRDFMELRVTPRAISDFERALGATLDLPDRPCGPPAIFSVSFGSLLALRAASASAYAEKVGAVMVFGGYADWAETVRFCLTGKLEGQPHAKHDPLNQPVVFMNLLPTMSGVPKDAGPLVAAWRQYCEATWGRDAYRQGIGHHEVARQIADEVDPAIRGLFLEGCGAEPGGYERCMEALGRAQGAYDFLDPRPFFGGLRCSAHLFHGVDDDVIPYSQLDQLYRALPKDHPASSVLDGPVRSHAFGRLRWITSSASDAGR